MKREELSKTLTDFYEKHENEKIYNLFHSREFRDIFDDFLKDSENNRSVNDKEYINLLGIILRLCNALYNNTGLDTGISDSEYDELMEYYKSISNDESIIGESSDSDDSFHTYKTLRGTLDKIYKITDEDIVKNKSQKTLDDWISQTERRYKNISGKSINLDECDIIVMPKFDGVSCIFECDCDGTVLRALTRGNTTTNEATDITHIVGDIYKGPIKSDVPYGVKTEIMMEDSDLETYNKTYHKDYKNTRSIVSSILNSKEKDARVEYLRVVPLRISYMRNGEESKQELAPEVYNYPYLKTKLKDIDKIHSFSVSHKSVFPGLRCDGSVIQITNEDIQKVLGRENNKQKFEVAFKFTEETGYTTVKDVIFTTGLFGRMNPVVIFDPIKLKGNTIHKASLGSFARFKNLELCKGDVIKVLYDIIPYIIYDKEDPKCSRSGKKPIKEPTYCPDCGEVLIPSEDYTILRCPNDKCPSRERGRILNYCNKMDISNISYATVEDFYHEGYLLSIADLYHLKDKIKSLCKIEGYGALKINSIIQEIDNHRNVSAGVFLGSLGIESVSVKIFSKILEYITLPELLEAAYDKNVMFFSVFPGIKEKTANKIVKGICDNKDLIDFLLNELNIDMSKKSASDFTVCYTKTRPDEEMKAFIESLNGECVDSVTKDTSIVVVPNLSVSSSKTNKAKKYDIPIIPENEIKNYILENYS